MMAADGSGMGSAEGQSPGLKVTSRASGTPESFPPAFMKLSSAVPASHNLETNA